MTKYTTAGAGNSRSRWLALPVWLKTSSINARGNTLASTPALIRCATSMRLDKALRVLAIGSIHRSFYGRGLLNLDHYLNSIAVKC